jgi:photosystem II stability/assembly factor-like uncharacterized protein
VCFTILASAAWAQDKPRSDQIQEIEKQIQELSKKLDALKKDQPKAAETGSVEPLVPEGFLKNLRWRGVGPSTMGGRIVDLAVNESDPNTWWAATASGGLLKTTNNGITFEHQFDNEATVSIGDVTVAPSDPNIVWVGTGENNPRNSSSYGDGVYKSTDGGKKWTNMGLKKSFQIGRIAIHPKDPNIVYVGVLGRLWGENDERGLYKTTDGGQTWNSVLFVDNKTGVIDFALNPSNPDELLVATWQRKRDIYDTNEPIVEWGPGSGLHKSTDAGKTWKKISAGLPTCAIGRIGLDYFRKDPKIVYMILTTEKVGIGPPQAAAGGGYLGVAGGESSDEAKLEEVVEEGPAAKAGLKSGDVVTKAGDKEVKNYDALLAEIRPKKPGDKLKFTLKRGDKTEEIEVTLGERQRRGQGGQTPRDPRFPFRDNLGGQAQNLADRQGPEAAESGGIYRSEDGGDSWKRVNSLNPRPMYFSVIKVDPNEDKYVYVLGISQYKSSDGGKTFSADAGRNVHADGHAQWIDPRDGRHIIHGGDGGIYVSYDRAVNWDHLNHAAIGQFYHVAVDSTREYKIYGGLQDNGSWGGPSRTRNSTGSVNNDWLEIGGGDGFKCFVDPTDPDLIYFTSQNGALGRRHLKTAEVGRINVPPQQGKPLVWNWNTPFQLSSHNPKIYYAAANYVFRSLDRGNDMRWISPKITRTDKGSATAFAESPRNPNILYVGTDDGLLWVSKDAGVNWTDITKNVGLPTHMYVDTIEASRFSESRVYACFDGHRSDNDDPQIFVSEDFGQTWKSLRANLPWGSSLCLREDILNENLLYLGTEFAVWASLDRGKSWAKINNNLPTVAVHDFALHPTVGELVAATHGRSFWILDVSALRQMSASTFKDTAQLFRPTAYVRWRPDPSRGRTNRQYNAENPVNSAQICYTLSKKPESLSIKILDVEGRTVGQPRGTTEPGFHRVTWSPAAASRGSGGGAGGGGGQRAVGGPGGSGGGGGGGGGGGSGPRRTGGSRLGPGTYCVLLTVDGKEFRQPLRVEIDPELPLPGLANDAGLSAWEQLDELELFLEENSEEAEREREMGGEHESEIGREGERGRDHEGKDGGSREARRNSSGRRID